MSAQVVACSSKEFCGIHLKVILKELFMNLIGNMY